MTLAHDILRQRTSYSVWSRFSNRVRSPLIRATETGRASGECSPEPDGYLIWWTNLSGSTSSESSVLGIILYRTAWPTFRARLILAVIVTLRADGSGSDCSMLQIG